MSLWHNLQIRIDKILNLYEWFKWMIKQYFKPRPIGTRITKKQGNFIVTYEIVGYTLNRFPKELLDEVSREKIIN